MRLLFVGENWRGSSARSLRESLERRSDVVLGEVGEDHFLPRYQTLRLRLANRALRRWQRTELAEEIRRKLAILKPDVFLVYKGNGISAPLVEEVSSTGVFALNVFPDYSPHAFGSRLREAMGVYDLVVSTKPFHPERWTSLYGYSNECVFVPHGYDPSIHYWPEPPEDQRYDVVLAASWRPEYEDLMRSLASKLSHDSISVAIAGPRWAERWTDAPKSWEIFGGLFGRAYGEFVRSGRIAIAPVNRRVSVNGRRQPGDQDTIRTYELAAAHTFFVHQRTEYAQTVYDEMSEVPMWGSASELAELLRHFLGQPDERRTMAASAHRRAVPDYSLDARADRIIQHVREALANRS